jgi:hypothetical protein
MFRYTTIFNAFERKYDPKNKEDGTKYGQLSIL